MATIRKELALGIDPRDAWDAARDFGNLHTRLVPGFVTDAHLEPGTGDRICTFFTGTVLRERLISCDDDARRLAWTVVDGPYEHHNGTLEVLDDPGGCRLVWTSDVLPDAIAAPTEEMMERGRQAMRRALDSGRSAQRGPHLTREELDRAVVGRRAG